MKTYRFAIAYIVIFILIAHIVVGVQYVWYRHTISQLAGQGYANAWLMRAGCTGILLYMLTDGPNSRRVVHAVALILTMGVAFSFFSLPMVAGALQRLLWIVGFAWLAHLKAGVALSQISARPVVTA